MTAALRGGESFDAVVVGAGMSGLMAAALLAHRGRRVFVAEAADRIGGYQCRVSHDGVAFEPHFHFLQDAAPGRPVRRLLDELGVELDWRRIAPLADFCFPHGRVTIPAERTDFIADLKAGFPSEARGIDAYFSTTRAIYDAAQALPRLGPALARYAGYTVDDLVSRYLDDPLLKVIAGGWAAYFGYGAAEISGAAIAVFTESCFDGGVLQPVGGIDAIARALRGVIESHDGTVAVSAPVARIVCSPHGTQGVVLTGGEQIHAPIVVSSVDPVTTLASLVDDPRARAAADRLVGIAPFRSPFTACVVARGARPGVIDGSPVKVVFPGTDTAAQDRAQLSGVVEHAPVSVGIPTLVNPELAPADTDLVLLYTFVDRARIASLLSDRSAAMAFAERLVNAADNGIPGLADRAVSIAPSTEVIPNTYAPQTAGALGWSPTPDVLLGSARTARAVRHPLGSALAAAAAASLPRVLERASDRSAIPGPATPVAGLHLCGQWTRTGAGMNNVFVSAAHAAAAAYGRTTTAAVR